MLWIVIVRYVLLTKISCHASDQKLVHPYGPLMCELVCQKESRCITHMFDVLELMCRLNVTAGVKLNLSGNAPSRSAAAPTYGDKTQKMDILRRSTMTARRITKYFTYKAATNKRGRVCPPAHVRTLWEASRGGWVSQVRKLLSREKVDINCPRDKGVTAVMEAAGFNQRKMFDFLVRKQCDLSAKDEKNDTVLHYACEGNSVYIVKKLLDDHNFNIETKGKDGGSPLMSSAIAASIIVFRFLWKRGAKLDIVNDSNDTILHGACGSDVVQFKMVELILSLEIIDINSRGRNGRTPLMNALEMGSRAVVNLLMERGVNVRMVDNMNNTVLHFACVDWDIKSINKILNSSVEVDGRGHLGRTPLMIAVKNGHKAVVKLLRSRGADINKVDDHGNTILHVACFGGHLGMVRYVYLLNKDNIGNIGALGKTPLMYAVKDNHIRFLLKRHKATLATDDDGQTVLHIACLAGHLHMVKYLVNLDELMGAEKMKNNAGKTPLQLAENNGHLKIVSFLKSRNMQL